MQNDKIRNSENCHNAYQLLIVNIPCAFKDGQAARALAALLAVARGVFGMAINLTKTQ